MAYRLAERIRARELARVFLQPYPSGRASDHIAGALLIVTAIEALMIQLDSADTAEEFTTSGYALMIWLTVVGLVLLQIGLVTM